MRKTESRQGIALFEFAMITALLLVPLLAGVWDISRFIDINQIMTRAAREAVVTASRGDDPTSTIKDYVDSAGLNPEHLNITIEYGPKEQTLGQEVAVKLAYTFTGYTIFPWEDFMPNGITTSAYAKME